MWFDVFVVLKSVWKGEKMLGVYVYILMVICFSLCLWNSCLITSFNKVNKWFLLLTNLLLYKNFNHPKIIPSIESAQSAKCYRQLIKYSSNLSASSWINLIVKHRYNMYQNSQLSGNVQVNSISVISLLLSWISPFLL